MAKLKEKKSESDIANELAAHKFEALNVIAQNENDSVNEKEEIKKNSLKQKLVTFNLSQADYDKYREWFGGKGLSVSMGLRMCLDYIYFEDKSEKLILTKSGIRENNLFKLN